MKEEKILFSNVRIFLGDEARADIRHKVSPERFLFHWVLKTSSIKRNENELGKAVFKR